MENHYFDHDNTFCFNSVSELDEDEFLYGDSNLETDDVKEEFLEQEPSL